MVKILTATLLAFMALPSARASADSRKIDVVASLSVLGSIAKEIGGDRVSVVNLNNDKRDPHTLVAKPTFKLAAKKAELFVELGLGLDIWAAAVVNASGNPAIQAGTPGHVIASSGIRTVELPKTLSKAWGDIHPYGNPHVWLDPVNVKQIASNIHDGLVRVDADHAAEYDKRLKRFDNRINVALYGKWLVDEYGASKLDRLSKRGRLHSYLERKKTLGRLGGWLKRAEPMRGMKIVTYHKTWIYFCNRFGLEIAAEIEEKPGIPPSQNYLEKLIKKIKAEGIKVMFIETFYPSKDGRFIAGKTGARVVSSQIDIGSKATDYFKLIDQLFDKIDAARR